MKNKLVRRIIILVCAVCLLVSGANIAKILYGYIEINRVNSAIVSEYVEAVSSVTDSSDTAEPVIIEPAITVDFKALLSRNSDVIGWLYCPNSVISYPTVKGEDNKKYLYADLDGNYLVGGTLFADYRCEEVGEGNTVIYGHSMKNGTMFGMLLRYKKQSYFEEHPVMYFLTPDCTYKIELVYGRVVDSSDEIYNMNTDAYSYIKENVSKSTFKTETEISECDSFITLSTCSYETDDSRFIVIGKLSVE